MYRKFNIIGLIASGIIFAAGCGATPPPVAPTSAPVATVAPAAQSSSSNAVPDSAKVMVADSTLGKILVDGKGMVLYMYTKDTPDVTVCYDQCATNWPPLLTKNKPTAGEGVDAALFGSTTRKDGTTQVTYKGWPLYYYIKDAAAGDVKGQNVGKVWYVLAPNGDVIK